MIEPLRDDLMVQQQLPGYGKDKIWQHMVAVIMLNQTGRKPVKTVFPIFLSKWFNSYQYLLSDPEEVKQIIWPLGMGNVREKRIRGMSEDFHFRWDMNDARMLHGIGKYGSDSYEIFFKQNYSVNPTDKELVRYLREEVLDNPKQSAII